MKRITALFLMVFALVACEEAIDNGIIPQKYLSIAQKYTGHFQGEFDGRQLDLDFTIDSNGYARLTAKDLDGKSELLAGCPVQIGQLLAVNGDEKKQTLKYARFDFNGRRCMIVGRDLYVNIDNPDQLSLEIAESSHIEYRPGNCYPTGGQNGGYYCEPSQQQEVIDRWLTGKFHRQ